jgi:hypothetical protein
MEALVAGEHLVDQDAAQPLQSQIDMSGITRTAW